jgi:hypothetical protein
VQRIFQEPTMSLLTRLCYTSCHRPTYTAGRSHDTTTFCKLQLRCGVPCNQTFPNKNSSSILPTNLTHNLLDIFISTTPVNHNHNHNQCIGRPGTTGQFPMATSETLVPVHRTPTLVYAESNNMPAATNRLESNNMPAATNRLVFRTLH